jgi:hypothetical protein
MSIFKKEKEEQKNSLPMAANKIDMGNIALHTMQDDKNMLEGKRPSMESDRLVGSSTFFDNDKKPSDMAGNLSPFLNGANPPPRRVIPGEDKAGFEPSKNPSGEPKKDITDFLGKTSVSAPESSALGKMFFWIAIIIVIGAFAFGGYYFWATRNYASQDSISSESDTTANQAATPEATTESPAEIAQGQFSESNPNYLPIDIGTATADSVKKLLIDKASAVKDTGFIAPVEFAVTDTNNDPVSFSAFNYISGLKLPVSVLTNLGDKFSLYLFNDNGNMRIGLAVELKDKEKVTAGIKSEEKLLAGDLTPLFMGIAVKNIDRIFKSSIYNDFSIRYNNLDDQSSISTDYSFTDKYLVIGTSKQTIRAVLDKISKQ